MTAIHRRTFLRGAGAAASAAVLGGPFLGFAARANAISSKPEFRGLRAVKDERDLAERLWLPEGFHYRSFHDTEFPVTLDDGTALPGRHDGMAAFAGPGGNSILVRNHEVNNPGSPFGPLTPYDAQARGGTTTIEVTPHGEVVNAYTSLNGTMMNCAGAAMPWGTYMSCEETVNGPDVGPDFTGVSNVPLQQRHGFIYEVPVDGPADGQPITAAGRFAHEAVAFDPQHGILYLTEDDFGFPSGFFRYIPATDPMVSGHLDNAGRLQMLTVESQPNVDLAADQPAGAKYKVHWVDIDDPAPSFPYTPGVTAPTTNNDAISYVGRQGFDQGAAYFSRLEGTAYEEGVVYFTSTQGGGPAESSFGPIADGYGNGNGQVWAYHTNSEKLELVFQSPGPDTLDFPDNITTSKRGTLILCEDNVNNNFIRGLTRGGDLFDIALNRLRSRTGADRSNDEFAGSTFSADGETLFVNIQASAGMSFAIWGPWDRIGV
jgi:secreted PhoX family phosphatase